MPVIPCARSVSSMLPLWNRWFVSLKKPLPWKSLPPDLEMALSCTPRTGISTPLPMAPTCVSSNDE